MRPVKFFLDLHRPESIAYLRKGNIPKTALSDFAFAKWFHHRVASIYSKQQLATVVIIIIRNCEEFSFVFRSYTSRLSATQWLIPQLTAEKFQWYNHVKEGFLLSRIPLQNIALFGWKNNSAKLFVPSLSDHYHCNLCWSIRNSIFCDSHW